MHEYKAISKGFYAGALYGPSEGRTCIMVPKKFKSTPSWMKYMGAADKGAVSKAKAAADKKAAENLALQKDTDEQVSFVTGEQVDSSKANNVEVLG